MIFRNLWIKKRGGEAVKNRQEEAVGMDEINLKKLDSVLRDLDKQMDLDYQNLWTIRDVCQDEFDALTKELREKI